MYVCVLNQEDAVWAFSEAAVLFLKDHPAAKDWHDKLVSRCGQGSRIRPGWPWRSRSCALSFRLPGENTSHSVHPVPFVQKGCPFP